MDPVIGDKLSQSIGLFSNIMGQVSQSTDFEKIQKQGMMYSQQFTQGIPSPSDSQMFFAGMS